MIHEGTHGIQGSDLLGRKVLMENGKALDLLTQRIEGTAQRARAVPALVRQASELSAAWSQVLSAARAAWATGRPDEALANAVPFMQGFGHCVLAWIWLDVCLAATAADPAGSKTHTQGVLGATQFFYHFELPKIAAWLGVVEARDMTCANLPEEAF